jgi:outer membrane protein assembly factor BamD
MNKNMLKRLAVLLIGVQIVLSGCAKVEHKEDLGLDQLKTKATASLKQRDYETACEYLQLMVSKFPEDPKIGNYKISLANCKFNNKEYESAFQLYENFHQYYPSDKRAEYAKYKAALCKFHQSLDFDRDQTATQHALVACNAYTQVPTYKKYLNEIDAARNKCIQKLVDKEISICKFYIKHGKIQAANKRLEQARKLYGAHKDLEANLLYLECKLASKTEDRLALEEKFDILAKKFPASQFAKMAENLVPTNATTFQF